MAPRFRKPPPPPAPPFSSSSCLLSSVFVLQDSQKILLHFPTQPLAKTFPIAVETLTFLMVSFESVWILNDKNNNWIQSPSTVYWKICNKKIHNSELCVYIWTLNKYTVSAHSMSEAKSEISFVSFRKESVTKIYKDESWK